MLYIQSLQTIKYDKICILYTGLSLKIKRLCSKILGEDMIHVETSNVKYAKMLTRCFAYINDDAQCTMKMQVIAFFVLV